MAEVWVWVQSVLKNGNPGRRVMQELLLYCDLCQKIGTRKNTRDREDVYGWNFVGPNDYTTKNKSMLCIGCWRKIRPLHKAARESEELKRYINLVQRTICYEHKQDN